MLSYLFLYVWISEFIVIGTLLIRMRRGSAEFDHFEQMTPRQRLISQFLFWALAVLLAPIFAPVILFSLHREVGTPRYWKDVRATHYELTFEPVHTCNIPDEFAEHIQRESTILESLGYHSLGTWWMKPEPFNSQLSCFLHPEGISIAEIGVTLGIHFCEISSYLEDGSTIVTVNCESFRVGKFTKRGFHINFCTGQDMADLVDAHQAFLQEVANEQQQVVRVMSQSDWKEYVIYHNRRFSQIKHELGECPDLVECIFPPRSMQTNDPEPAASPSADTTPLPTIRIHS